MTYEAQLAIERDYEQGIISDLPFPLGEIASGGLVEVAEIDPGGQELGILSIRQAAEQEGYYELDIAA